MAYAAVGKLMDKWVNDSRFREELRKDPQGTVQKTGIQLTPDEWQALQKVDWAQSDEELKTRLSKGA